MRRFPDSPVLASTDRLERIDADSPGMWIGSSKKDGRRRMAYKENGRWTYQAKNRDDAQPLPDDLRAEFESLNWPDGIGLDLEYCGLRKVGDRPSLWVFDLLMDCGEWCGLQPYARRLERLSAFWSASLAGSPRPARVNMIPTVSNPGLIDCFLQQCADDLSEGIVVRRADSTLIGNWNRSVENPAMLKIKFERVRSNPRLP